MLAEICGNQSALEHHGTVCSYVHGDTVFEQGSALNTYLAELVKDLTQRQSSEYNQTALLRRGKSSGLASYDKLDVSDGRH